MAAAQIENAKAEAVAAVVARAPEPNALVIAPLRRLRPGAACNRILLVDATVGAVNILTRGTRAMPA